MTTADKTNVLVVFISGTFRSMRIIYQYYLTAINIRSKIGWTSTYSTQRQVGRALRFYLIICNSVFTRSIILLDLLFFYRFTALAFWVGAVSPEKL